MEENELFSIKTENFIDKQPVYVMFEKAAGLESQWGIVDMDHRLTIHKDFKLSFSDRLKYFAYTNSLIHYESQSCKDDKIILFSPLSD